MMSVPPRAAPTGTLFPHTAVLRSRPQSPPVKRRGLFSLRQLHRRHHITRIAERSDEAVEMFAVARLAFDVGDQPLCGQRREDALVIDFDDVDLLLVEQDRKSTRLNSSH